MRDLPHCDIALVVDARCSGSNLKVANLENMLEAARHDFSCLPTATCGSIGATSRR